MLDEKKEILISMLSADDLFMLWAKPLMASNCKKEVILEKAKMLESVELIERIETGIVSQSETNMINIKSNE